MNTGEKPAALQLSEEEAYALLVMCLMSPHGIDKTTESALRRLAEYCANLSTHKKSIELFEAEESQIELKKAGSE